MNWCRPVDGIVIRMFITIQDLTLFCVLFLWFRRLLLGGGMVNRGVMREWKEQRGPFFLAGGVNDLSRDLVGSSLKHCSSDEGGTTETTGGGIPNTGYSSQCQNAKIFGVQARRGKHRRLLRALQDFRYCQWHQ